MPRGNALDALRLLRRIEMEEARRHMAKALEAEAVAARSLAQVRDALTREGDAADAAQYAAWLPAARAQLDQALRFHNAARSALAPERDAVARASRAERGVVEEQARRAQIRRDGQLAMEQLALDELVAAVRRRRA